MPTLTWKGYWGSPGRRRRWSCSSSVVAGGASSRTATQRWHGGGLSWAGGNRALFPRLVSAFLETRKFLGKVDIAIGLAMIVSFLTS